jgi:hypothetical protein
MKIVDRSTVPRSGNNIPWEASAAFDAAPVYPFAALEAGRWMANNPA